MNIYQLRLITNIPLPFNTKVFITFFKDILIMLFSYSQKAPLHIAVEKGNVDLINILLSSEGININIEDGICKNFFYLVSLYIEWFLYIFMKKIN